MIRVGGQRFAEHVKVFDVSETGARILADRDCTIPDKFSLELRSGVVLKCEVVWRSTDGIGVKFATAANETLSVQLQMLLQMILARAGASRTFEILGETLTEYRACRRAGVWAFSEGQYHFTPSGSPSPTFKTSDLFTAAEAATGQTFTSARRR